MSTAKTQSKKEKSDQEFAVIETGGKQYSVTVGDVVTVESINELETGDSFKFDKVLLVDDGQNTSIGTPYLEGAIVEAKVTEVGRGRKIAVIHYRSKSRHFKNKGHRQPYMKVQVTAIK